MSKKIFVLIFLAFSYGVFAESVAEAAFELIEDESAREISRAIETDYSFAEYKNGPEKMNLLMYALENDREPDVIKVLLRSGISPVSADKNGKTALMYACENESDIEAIKMVLEYGAPFDHQRKRRILKKDKAGNNCFDYARMNDRQAEVISYLSKYAADPRDSMRLPEEESSLDTTPVLEEPTLEEIIPVEEAAVVSALDEIVAEPQVEAEIPAEVEEAEPEIEVPVEEQLAVEEEIPQETIVVDIPGPEQDVYALSQKVGPTVVMESIYLYDYASLYSEDDKIPEYLIDRKSDSYSFIENADKKDAKGTTLLMKAAKKGDLKQMENLMFSGAKLEDKDNEGWTALMYAVRFQNNADVVKFLLASGASPLEKNNYGISAMLLAAGYSKNPEIISDVIKPYKNNSEELRAAFVFGIRNGNKAENLLPFIQKKMNMNEAFNGKSYLMYACESNRTTDIIELLLKSGASKYQMEALTGNVAFDYAKANKRLKHDSVYWSLNTD